ncbi:hypothetical protein D3C81_2132010 [compost metagenome]
MRHIGYELAAGLLQILLLGHILQHSNRARDSPAFPAVNRRKGDAHNIRAAAPHGREMKQSRLGVALGKRSRLLMVQAEQLVQGSALRKRTFGA